MNMARGREEIEKAAHAFAEREARKAGLID
jgi:hypothetical protein